MVYIGTLVVSLLVGAAGVTGFSSAADIDREIARLQSLKQGIAAAAAPPTLVTTGKPGADDLTVYLSPKFGVDIAYNVTCKHPRPLSCGLSCVRLLRATTISEGFFGGG